MNYQELLDTGRAMGEAEIKASLRSLAADARFAAVFGFLERRRSSFTRAASAPGLAGKPGELAHVCGGLHESLNVLDSLKQVLEPAAPRGPQPPEE